MAAIRRNAGQNLGQRFRISWRSWEPESGSRKNPLILLHPLPHNGSFFSVIAPLLAQDRLVLAPDYPGYGASWPLEGPPTISLYAQAVLEAWLSLGVGRQPDLFGFHTGCLVAPELALCNSGQVGRLVLVDVPYFSAEERKAKLLEPWAVDGFMAAFCYSAEQDFPRVENETLVIATRSSLREPSHAAAAVLPKAQLLDMPGVAAPALETGATSIAAASREFLDA